MDRGAVAVTDAPLRTSRRRRSPTGIGGARGYVAGKHRDAAAAIEAEPEASPASLRCSGAGGAGWLPEGRVGTRRGGDRAAVGAGSVLERSAAPRRESSRSPRAADPAPRGPGPPRPDRASAA